MQTKQTTSTNHQHQLTYGILLQIWKEWEKKSPTTYRFNLGMKE